MVAPLKLDLQTMCDEMRELRSLVCEYGDVEARMAAEVYMLSSLINQLWEG